MIKFTMSKTAEACNGTVWEIDLQQSTDDQPGPSKANETVLAPPCWNPAHHAALTFCGLHGLSLTAFLPGERNGFDEVFIAEVERGSAFLQAFPIVVRDGRVKMH